MGCWGRINDVSGNIGEILRSADPVEERKQGVHLDVEPEPTSKTCLISRDFTKSLLREAEVLKLQTEC